MGHYEPEVDRDYEGRHVLYRHRTTYDYEAVYVEGEEVGGDFAKTQALGLTRTDEIERTRTIYCTCGEAFRLESRAIDHIHDVGAVEDHEFDPERWKHWPEEG